MPPGLMDIGWVSATCRCMSDEVGLGFDIYDVRVRVVYRVLRNGGLWESNPGALDSGVRVRVLGLGLGLGLQLGLGPNWELLARATASSSSENLST